MRRLKKCTKIIEMLPKSVSAEREIPIPDFLIELLQKNIQVWRGGVFADWQRG